MKKEKIFLKGVDYYPEQWDESMIDADLDTIVELGANVIRIGEFAWHLMEREEEKYDFSFFDMVIKKAKRKNLYVIFGTPTATPPAWLIKKYPEIASYNEDGTKRSYGGRHTYCFSSNIYREYCAKIIRQLARHYKDENAIVAWQIDNELGHEGSDICYCDKCRKKFQDYLKDKFCGDIDKLNFVYGTAFWSQQYNAFDEIPLPSKTITVHNPALRLDWERFLRDNIVSFAKEQTDIIKSEIKDAVVIHDFPGGGLGKHTDYSRIARDTDKVAYNHYPVWGGQKYPLPPNEIAFALDYARGLRSGNFMITEAIMGAQGHDVTGYLPRPGQAGMWSMQALARGCDSLLYFRYRGATKGAEQFCYGVIDADNTKGRKFFEVKSVFENIEKYKHVLQTQFKAQVCIVYNYDSLACFRIQRQSLLFDSEGEMKKLHKAFYDKNVAVDIIPDDARFEDYKIVVVPNMIIMGENTRKRLQSFVADGGVVIVTYRTAVKDEDNNLVFGKKLPVDCQELFGVTVCETESVQETDCIPLISPDGEKATAGVFRDMLMPTTAKTLYRYADDFYDGYSAVTQNAFGKGEVYYIATSPSEQVLSEIVKGALEKCGVPYKTTPCGVECISRECEGKTYEFVINHNAEKTDYCGVLLKPFEVAVSEIK